MDAFQVASHITRLAFGHNIEARKFTSEESPASITVGSPINITIPRASHYHARMTKQLEHQEEAGQ
jgi:hypothetical protein